MRIKSVRVIYNKTIDLPKDEISEEDEKVIEDCSEIVSAVRFEDSDEVLYNKLVISKATEQEIEPLLNVIFDELKKSFIEAIKNPETVEKYTGGDKSSRGD